MEWMSKNSGKTIHFIDLFEGLHECKKMVLALISVMKVEENLPVVLRHSTFHLFEAVSNKGIDPHLVILPETEPTATSSCSGMNFLNRTRFTETKPRY